MFHNIENSHDFEKYLPASKSIPLLRSIQVNINFFFIFEYGFCYCLFLDGT